MARIIRTLESGEPSDCMPMGELDESSWPEVFAVASDTLSKLRRDGLYVSSGGRFLVQLEDMRVVTFDFAPPAHVVE